MHVINVRFSNGFIYSERLWRSFLSSTFFRKAHINYVCLKFLDIDYQNTLKDPSMPFDKSNADGSSSFAEGAQQLVYVSFQFLLVHSIPCASWIFQPNSTMLWTYSLFKFINFGCFLIKKHRWYPFQICQFWLFSIKKHGRCPFQICQFWLFFD